MRKLFRYAGIIAINLLVLAVLLAAVEGYFRYREGPQPAITPKNALWQEFRPYIMFTTTDTTYPGWHNLLTGKHFDAHVTTNSLGFRDDRQFSPISVYRKEPGEKVVLFTGGSAAWGVGATANANTIAGRMERHLNEGSGGRAKYTVVNLAMGSFIAYQQMVALSLYGTGFDPDWVVVMDGYNDANVFCAQSQGAFNPMYFSVMKLYLDGYLMSTHQPVLFRGELENTLLKHSAAARTLTRHRYIALEPVTDPDGESSVRQVIRKTRIAEARDHRAFYLRSQELTFRLFPRAKFLFSTQPVVNDFRADFLHAYDFPDGSPERTKAMAERSASLEGYLEAHKDLFCGVKTYQPAYTYSLVTGAFELEKLAKRLREDSGRFVGYVNTGSLLPNDREKRMPYFIDSAHLTDEGMDLLGKYYAERILGVDGGPK